MWDNDILKNEIEKLEEELNRKKYEQKEDDKNRDLHNSLHSNGIIDATEILWHNSLILIHCKEFLVKQLDGT